VWRSGSLQQLKLHCTPEPEFCEIERGALCFAIFLERSINTVTAKWHYTLSHTRARVHCVRTRTCTSARERAERRTPTRTNTH
jgi:hypothetical protein